MTRRDASAVDDSLVELPALLVIRGLVLKQKDGYRAGKLAASRNWCHIIDTDSYPELRTHNARGQIKTWKLLARFDAHHPPTFPWDRLRQCEGKRPPGLICGEDVWGISREDLQSWLGIAPGRQIAERLASDLQISFNYSRQHYC